MPFAHHAPIALSALVSLAAFAVAATPGCAAARAPSRPVATAPVAAACLAGVYVSRESDVVVLAKSAVAPGALRFVRPDGETGVFRAARDGQSMTAGPGYSDEAPAVAWLRHRACDDPRIDLRFGDGAEGPWTRAPVRTHPIRFASAGVTLAGEWIEPAAAARDAPLVVLVHGSERTAAIGANSMALLLASRGIGAFVYDKRGTGASGGTYTQNFTRLAGDAAAAVEEARRVSAGRYARVGLLGGSQGGWVAPLAARIVGADFVVVTFGLVATPLEEDAFQVADELARRGYPEAVLDRAREVTDATGAVVASHFMSGFDGLADVKLRFAAEPWFSEIRGEYTGDVLAESEAALRATGRAKYDDLDIEWRYDARAVLASLRAPELWVLAADDTEAPSAVTLARLKALQGEGRPIDVAVFPRTDHGIKEFATLPDGTRKATRFARGYFALVGDWILGSPRPPYGASMWIPRHNE